MKKITALILVLLLSVESYAQIAPPKRNLRPVTDPNMVYQSGWTKIEIFPAQRVSVATNSVGTRLMMEKRASPSARVSAREPVLIFNHAYQQFGYATGEIAFRFKGDKSLSAVRGIVPGAEAVGTQFYVVNVQTPAEILDVTKRLAGRADVDWVVPTVRYLPLSSGVRE